ncbi:hypothetical protein A2U01_0091469, partial [Trifolium medium]|nr:hypothetical protein [Trifolium medium]
PKWTKEVEVVRTNRECKLRRRYKWRSLGTDDETAVVEAIGASRVIPAMARGILE